MKIQLKKLKWRLAKPRENYGTEPTTVYYIPFLMNHPSKKTFSTLIVVTVILSGMFLPVAKSNAQESMQSALRDIVGKIGALFNLGFNNELSPEEKQQQELQTRKDTVSKILDLTRMEQADLLNRLAGLKTLTDAQGKMRNTLTSQLAGNENSFKHIQDRLTTADTTESVRQLATDFKNWRTVVYDPKAKQTVAFTFVFNGKSILATAQKRLENISKDLNDRKNTLGDNADEITELFEKATNSIKDAEELHNQAKILVMAALTSLNKPMSQLALSQKVSDMNTRNIADSKKLTEQSLQNIQTAYKIFIELGAALK